MALDTTQIKRYFNSTINTVAIDSPTGSERTVINQIAADIAVPLKLELYIWDCAQALTRADIKLSRGGKFQRLERNPATNFKPKGHPVEDLLRHIMAECKSSSASALFVIKDLYPFFNVPSPNPSLIRLAIDTWFDVKRSPNKVIILHDSLGTPKAFQDLVADMVNPLPNEAETKVVLKQRIEELVNTAKNQGVDFKVELNETDRDRIVRALLGMTQEAMDDTIQLCAVQQGRLSSQSADIISKIKKEKLATRGVEFADDPDVEVQGMPFLHHWIQTVTPLLEEKAQKEWNLGFPRGMLTIGVGGTGKSLAAKCLAHTWSLPIIVLDFGSMMSSRLGESEQKLKESLRAAESIAPCILWADEFDKAFNGSTGSESDGGTSARMFGYFLRWTIESKAPVFIAATANRPWGFKGELLRRFQTIYVDLPNRDARKQIWGVQLKKYKIQLSEPEIATLAAESENFTGDEINKIVYHCAGVAYGERRPGQVTVPELIAQIRSKPPQFEQDEELEKLRTWARSGKAMWAAPDPATESNSRIQSLSWDGERSVKFSPLNDTETN